MGRKNYGNTKLEMASLHSGDLDVVTDGNVLEVASIININLPVCSCCKYWTVGNKQESWDSAKLISYFQFECMTLSQVEMPNLMVLAFSTVHVGQAVFQIIETYICSNLYIFTMDTVKGEIFLMCVFL